jgi:probable phosphoglycerate mutase
VNGSTDWPWVLPRAPAVFVRHGESEANVADIVAGSRDVPLTARGRVQAGAIAERLADFAAVAIYTSALSRARDTAEIVAASLRLPVFVVPELAERDWGAWEGRPRAGLDRAADPPGGETATVFADRVLRGLAGVDWRVPAVIVGHSGTFRVLAAHLGLAGAAERIANAVPVRLIPPQDAAGAWTMTAI